MSSAGSEPREGLMEKRARGATMRGLWCSSDGEGKDRLRVREDLPMPELNRDEALVEILVAGVCSTDLQLSRGYKGGFDGVLGHEFVGRVVEVREPGHAEWIGERVVGSINIAKCDPVCSACRRFPKGNHCAEREVVGIYKKQGCSAEYLSIPVRNLLKVPTTLSTVRAVFCEPLAAAFRACEQIEERISLKFEGPIVVLGDGKLACLIAQALRVTFKNRDIVVFGKHQDKLDRLIHNSIGIQGLKLIDHLAEYSGKCVAVVEATGRPGSLDTAIQLCSPAGLVIVKSTCAPPSENETSPACLSLASSNDIVVREIQIAGSRCGDFSVAIAALEKGLVNVDFLVGHQIPLKDAASAIDRASEPGALKVLIAVRE